MSQPAQPTESARSSFSTANEVVLADLRVGEQARASSNSIVLPSVCDDKIELVQSEHGEADLGVDKSGLLLEDDRGYESELNDGLVATAHSVDFGVHQNHIVHLRTIVEDNEVQQAEMSKRSGKQEKQTTHQIAQQISFPMEKCEGMNRPSSVQPANYRTTELKMEDSENQAAQLVDKDEQIEHKSRRMLSKLKHDSKGKITQCKAAPIL
ncbi:hypothetical protein LIER_01990 [Lithospermum erythrorhizon]|uniref:Uncharacterized protein n=1 Tax=Lithospermum erythrorhizon TaxID=34254 RepID=A0AAV3NNK9_LITER